MLLIIGYGNTLRTDDGVGTVVASALSSQFHSDTTQVITAHQLTPELAEPISHASLAVFIDAGEGMAAGSVACRAVVPAAASGAFTHNVTPESLLAVAHDLYGSEPRGLLISIGGEAFDFGAEFSPVLRAALPEITTQVFRLIEDNRMAHHA